MFLGHGLLVGFVLGVVVTIMVQRRIRRKKLKLVQAAKGPLAKVFDFFSGTRKPGDHDKEGRH